MPLFEIATQSTFENIYLVEADTKEQAVEHVLDANESPDFYQKHLGEGMREVKQFDDYVTTSQWIQSVRDKGYA